MPKRIKGVDADADYIEWAVEYEVDFKPYLVECEQNEAASRAMLPPPSA